jgi:hypothetical protein
MAENEIVRQCIMCFVQPRKEGKTTEEDMSFKNLKCRKEEVLGPLSKQHIIRAAHGSAISYRTLPFPQGEYPDTVQVKT